MGRLVQEIWASLPDYKFIVTTVSSLNSSLMEVGAVSLLQLLQEWELQEEEDKLQTFAPQKLGKFETLEKAAVYQLCVKVCHLESLVGVKVLKWTEVFSHSKSLKGRWRSL